MKRSLVLFILLAIGFASCKKGDTVYNAPYVPPFLVEGVRDATLQKRSSGLPVYNYSSIYVSYANSVQEKVTLSVSGAPSGLKAYVTDSSGYPSFSTYLYLVDSAAAPGAYKLKLVATGAKSGRLEFPFNVNILAAPTCASFVVGNNYSSTNCNSSTSYYQNVTAVSGTTNRVVFSNFDNTGNQVEAVVDCDNGYITIPTQTVNGTTYYGNYGRYSSGGTSRYINIDYNYSTPSGGTRYCNVYMTL